MRFCIDFCLSDENMMLTPIDYLQDVFMCINSNPSGCISSEKVYSTFMFVAENLGVFLYQPGSRKLQNHKFVLRKQVNNTPLITQEPPPLVHATKQSSMLFPWKVPQESRKARGITVISCLLHFPVVRNKHVTKMKVT